MEQQISLANIAIEEIVVHQVGNKAAEDEMELTDAAIDLTDVALLSAFHRYFFASFSGNEMYQFYHAIQLDLNELFILSKKIFDDPSLLLPVSKQIAQHLYNCSTHPKIKGGELYVCYLKDAWVGDEKVAAIGLFKSETKDEFLKVAIQKRTAAIAQDLGTNINKLDKGCIIFNTQQDAGLRVCIIDNLNKSTEAQYWKDDFLSLYPVKNEYHQTNHFLGITKQFVTKQLADDFDVTKTDQIDLLNRSVEYFKNHEEFDRQEFETEVLYDEQLINSFRQFDENYRRDNEVYVADQFTISEQAVKKQARVFKSVLKLDKNFHIYIHGDKELIESGVDEFGRKFYKIYYEQEF